MSRKNRDKYSEYYEAVIKILKSHGVNLDDVNRFHPGVTIGNSVLDVATDDITECFDIGISPEACARSLLKNAS